MVNCIFCKIVKKELPSALIYEDETTLAFLSIGPATKGHALVIPKKHYEVLGDIPEEVLGKLMASVKKVSTAVKEATKAALECAEENNLKKIVINFVGMICLINCLLVLVI